MMLSTADFGGRRAPYAPISALDRFFEKIRDRAVPEHVDHRFLQKLNVASNNEYSLLSALKFLGVLDDRGRPTHAYRLLQTSDRFEDTLRHLVITAYKPVFEAGADGWSAEDLVNFFRRSSSASQAKNAARFFYAVCRLAGITPEPVADNDSLADEGGSEELIAPVEPAEPAGVPDRRSGSAERDLVLAAKARLLEKLPAALPGWSAAEYERICALFLEMVKSLDSR